MILSLARRCILPLTDLLVLTFLWYAAPVSAQPAATGAITGRVLNTSTGAYLSGVSIAVADSPRLTTVSGEGGYFRLNSVPTGAHTLTFEYTGLDPSRLEVTVSANAPTQVNAELTAAVYRLEAFNVSAVREGQAKAISQQRAAPNVQNVVSTDAFGNVADSNLGNLLLKLPGIVPVIDEGGEVLRVSVRGINPDLNSVSVDGTLLAGATTRSTDRSFEVDKVSTNSIESVEVIKSPTPDMDADSIGGKINLRTRSALDRKGRDFNYSLGANTYVPRLRSHPSASLAYSDTFGPQRRLGLALSASFNRTFSPQASVRAGFLNPNFNAPAAVNDFQHSEDDIRLDRLGLGARLDYKLSESTRVFFNSMYNNFEDAMRQHKYRVRLSSGQVLLVNDLVTEFRNGQGEYEMESRVRTVKTGMVQIGGKTELSRYHLDYDLSTSRSTGNEKREDLVMRVNSVGYRIDRTNRLHFPTFTQISGPDVSNYDNAYVNAMNQKDFLAWDRVTAGQFNLRRDFTTTWPTYLKTGLRYRSQEKRQDRNQDVWTYVGPDRRAGPVNGVSDDNLNRFRDDGHYYSPILGRYPRPVWPNWDAMHEERRQHPELFSFNANSSLQNALQNDNTAGEDIYAAYLMGNVKLGSLSILGGLRIERTDTSGTSPVLDRSKSAIAERFGKINTVTGSYTNVFPGLHLRYALLPNVLLRASASTSIGRPNFSQLIPSSDIDPANNVIRQNNPSLKPQFSDNYDLSAEYYSRTIGLLSVGLFRKNLVDFAFNTDTVVGGGANNGFDGLYEGYVLRTRTNGGWAKVDGLELNYQQQLTFLPGFLNGFGVYANATFLRTEGTYDGTVVLTDLSGFVKRTGNIGISYIKHGLTVRTSLNHVGLGLTSYNNDPAQRQYQEARNKVDLSIRYAYRPRLSVFADVTNVFSEKTFVYQGVGYRPVIAAVYGARLTTGIRGSF